VPTLLEPIIEPPPPPESDDDNDDNGDNRDDQPWLTVRTFWEPIGAHLALAHLETADIQAVLLDENVVAMDWLMANAVGGIKVKVRASDFAEADRILTTQIPTAAPTGEIAETITGATACCPRCDSDEIYQESIWRRPAVILLVGASVASFGLLLFLVLPWILALPGQWHCLRCGHQWLSQRRGFDVQSNSNPPPNTLDPASEV
jgi:hypothetical protein